MCVRALFCCSCFRRLRVVEVRVAKQENPALKDRGYAALITHYYDLSLDLMSYSIHDAHLVKEWSAADREVMFGPDFMYELRRKQSGVQGPGSEKDNGSRPKTWKTRAELADEEKATLDLRDETPRDPQIPYLPAEKFPLKRLLHEEENGCSSNFTSRKALCSRRRTLSSRAYTRHRELSIASRTISLEV